jgi:hypothetical protein
VVMTPSTATTMDERRLGIPDLKPTDFYVYMSVSAAAVAFLGFAPTYWAPLITGTFKGHPVLHLHAAVFFSWTLFVVLQTWLAASGRVARHRTLGMAGVSFATAMTIFGFLATVAQVRSFAAAGYRETGEAFAIVPVASIVFFAITFICAVANIRRPEWHKRLMLLATISILDAPIARWLVVFLAPPDASGPPPVGVEILPAAAVAMLLAVAVVHDWRTRGRPHSAYVAGGLAFVTVKVLQVPVSERPVWHAVAGWLLAFAG